jgi:hypothetical protein
VSSNLVKSRTRALPSKDEWAQPTTPARLVWSAWWPVTQITGTRSAQALYRAIEACCRPTAECTMQAIGLPAILA